MNKTLVIGNRSCPVTLSYTKRIVFHTDISNSIPITTKAIATLTNSFDNIVIQLPLSTNDHLVQGEPSIVNEFILYLFWMVTNKTTTKLYIQTGHDLTLMNKDSITTPLEMKASSLRTNDDSSRHSVTSVQTWQTASFHNPDELAHEYYSWLGTFTKKIIKVDIEQDEAHFRILKIPYPLLVLKKMPQVSINISEWEIKSGLLNKMSKKKKAPLGRLWFIVNGEQRPFTIYSALTHFRPAMPWAIYRLTQAIIHPFVMNQFKKHNIR